MPDWLEIAVRTLIAVIVLFFLTKLLGKRQISQLSLFEYITGITIGSLAAYISLDLEAEWYLGLVSIGVWVAASLGIEFLQLKNKTLRDFIDGKATILIKDGKIMEENMKKERITADELMEQLRSKNTFLADNVEFAVMEPSGEVSVLLKREHQPLTLKSLGLAAAPVQEPQTVIMDGKLLDEPLATIGLSRVWLNEELEKQGVTIDNVFLGQVDMLGQLYLDLFDDQLKVPQPASKAKLFADLKKIEADLEMFALSTDNEQSKQLYTRCSQAMQEVVDGLRKVLTQ